MVNGVPLPAPATTAELYLATILAELQGIRQSLDALQPAQQVMPSNQVELREPQPDAERERKKRR